MAWLGLEYIDFFRKHTDKYATMNLAFAKLGFVGRHRRLIALLVIVAWVFAPLVCSHVDDIVGPSYQSTAQEHFDDDASGHHAPDPCCQALAHASVVLHKIVTVHSDEAVWVNFAHVMISSVPDLISAPGTTFRIDQFFHGPPRIRGVRFATFWPHAPPSTL
jgi:hypothetical protein